MLDMVWADQPETATAFWEQIVAEMRRGGVSGRELLREICCLEVVGVLRLEKRKVRLFRWLVEERMGW